MSQPTAWYKLNPDTGQDERIELERWVWVAVYDDGSVFEQFDKDGRFHNFGEIDLMRIVSFGMRRANQDNVQYRIEIKPCMTPIHFYRHRHLDVNSPNYRYVKTYCFGYKENKDGRASKVMMEILPDDSLLIFNHDDRDA